MNITGDTKRPLLLLTYMLPNFDAPNLIKSILLYYISINTVIIDDFNTRIPPIDRSPEQK